MMAGLASLEKDLIAERIIAGIRRAQSESQHCGRSIKVTVEQVRDVLDPDLSSKVQDRLALHKATFYQLKTFWPHSDI